MERNRTDARSIAGPVMAGALALALAVTAAASYSAAGYVFFHRTVGEWEVLCAGADRTSRRTCRLSAPPAKIADKAPQNVMVVSEPAADAFEVTLQIRDLVKSGLPAFLRIDGFQTHEALIRDGRAVWRGAAALRIVSEMRAGRSAVFRIQTMPDGMPRDTRVSLIGFRDALADYRTAVRTHGLLTAR